MNYTHYREYRFAAISLPLLFAVASAITHNWIGLATFLALTLVYGAMGHCDRRDRKRTEQRLKDATREPRIVLDHGEHIETLPGHRITGDDMRRIHDEHGGPA